MIYLFIYLFFFIILYSCCFLLFYISCFVYLFVHVLFVFSLLMFFYQWGSLRFLAHLARRGIVTYCHTSASAVRRASCVVRQHLNKYSNIFYKTTGPTVLKFHMEHGLTPGFTNCKIGSGRISKIAAVTKNSKNNTISFFSRITRYFWLNMAWKINET